VVIVVNLRVNGTSATRQLDVPETNNQQLGTRLCATGLAIAN
jgi:hypothetical protein